MNTAGDQAADPGEMPRLKVTPNDGRTAPITPGQLSALTLQHGSMQLRWYAPGNVDAQTPHDRDELYVVVIGSAVFARGDEATPFGEEDGLTLLNSERVAVEPGDALFVPAGTPHWFEEMSSDFGAWIIFYGPEGGEPAVLPQPPGLAPANLEDTSNAATVSSAQSAGQ